MSLIESIKTWKKTDILLNAWLHRFLKYSIILVITRKKISPWNWDTMNCKMHINFRDTKNVKTICLRIDKLWGTICGFGLTYEYTCLVIKKKSGTTRVTFVEEVRGMGFRKDSQDP